MRVWWAFVIVASACGQKPAPPHEASTPIAIAPIVADAAIDAGIDAAGPSAWRWENPSIVADFTAVWGSSTTDVYAIGNRGEIAHTRDGGATWKLEASGVTTSLFGVWGSAANDVFVVGFGGVILHSTDGATWKRQKAAGRSNLIAVGGTGPRDVVVADSDGYVLRSSDSGATWRASRASSDITAMKMAVDARGVTILGYVEDRGVVLTSADGKTWAREARERVPHAIGGTHVASSQGLFGSDRLDDTPVKQRVFAIAGDFAVGESGAIWRTDGHAWKPQTSGVDQVLRGLWNADATTAFAVGDNGTIVKTIDGGMMWKPLLGFTAHDLRGVAIANEPIAVGAGGTIARRTRSGWQLDASPVTESLAAVWANGSDIVIVGDTGTILRSKGTTWDRQMSGTTANLRAVWGSGHDVFAAGADGVILQSSDGKTWTKRTSTTTSTLRAIWGRSTRDVYACASDGTIVRSTDGGATWVRMAEVAKRRIEVDEMFRAIWGSGSADLYVVGEAGVFHSPDGTTWSRRALAETEGDPVAIWGTAPDDVYLVTDRHLAVAGAVYLDGSILHSTDRGQTWQRIARPDWATTPDTSVVRQTWGLGLSAIAGSAGGMFVVGWSGAIVRFGP